MECSRVSPRPIAFRLLFAQHFFDARKHFVFFQTHMIVKKFPEAANFFRFNRSLRRQPLLEIPHGGANLGMIGEDAHDFGDPDRAACAAHTRAAALPPLRENARAPILCQNRTNFSAWRSTAAARFSAGASAARRISSA